MLLYLYIGMLLFNPKTSDGMLRRRMPVSVLLPEYIRLSSDPHTTKKEEMIAKSKGINVALSFNKRERDFYFTKYDCCLGYERVKHRQGCPKDKLRSVDNIMQVAGKLGLSNFVNLVRKSMLHYVFRNIGPITVFIPSNDALRKYLGTKVGKRVLRHNSFLRQFLVMHVFGGRWPKELIKIRSKLENILPGSSREMNVKIYDKNMIIQNALIMKSDQPAFNGIVHVIDDVLRQSYGTVRYIVGKHNNLKIFNEGLSIINYKMDGFNTIFAPTDEAFKRFNIRKSSDLVHSFKCLKEFILTHIVHGLFFNTIMSKQSRILLQNHLDDNLSILEFNKRIYINSALVKMEYFAATDGSVYTIDRLLISSKALSVQKLAKRIHSLSMVEEMMKRTNFEQRYFPPNQSLTLFLPSNKAIKNMGFSALKNLKKKKDDIIEFLLSHMTIGKYHTRDLRTNMVLKSLTNHSIQVNARSKMAICIQGSSTSYRLRNMEACNSIVHVITLYPIQYSNHTILSILKNDSRFSILTMALRIADMSDYVDRASPITFFAPNNEAWSLLDNKTLNDLFEDSRRLKYIIRYHLISSAVYPCDIKAGVVAPFSLTGTRVRLSFKNSYSNTIKYNYAETIGSDITARNGVLYVINNVVRYLYKRKYKG